MADEENPDTPMEEAVEGEAPAEPEPTGPMDPMDALKEVLKKAQIHDGLARGLHEACKALESGKSRLCCLAEDVDEDSYNKIVRALCDEHNVSLVMVPEGKKLGEWCGLCKIDEEGEATKVVGCSCAVVLNYGEDSHALNCLMEHLKKE